MTAEDFGQAPVHGSYIEGAREPQCSRQIIGCVTWGHLVEKPKPLLGKGQRRRPPIQYDRDGSICSDSGAVFEVTLERRSLVRREAGYALYEVIQKELSKTVNFVWLEGGQIYEFSSSDSLSIDDNASLSSARSDFVCSPSGVS
jgi:hypothetical protein